MLISKHDLARLLSSVTKAVEKSNVPILATVRLVADGSTLQATATNLDIEIAGSIPADGSLACCVDAKLLSGIVSKAGGDVTLEHDGNTLTVKSGRSRFKLPTLPVEDFPDLTAGEFAASFDVDLAALVAPVSFAISTEMTRYYLCGVYLEGTEDGLTATATDGHRLATKTTEPVATFKSVILPAKLVAILPKGNVRVSLSPTKVRIETTDTAITSKLIDGTFPDYERVIPRSNDKVISVAPDAVKSALGRVSVMLSERGRGAKFAIANNNLTLTIANADGGAATEDVDVSYDGEPIEIGFNGQYVNDVLSMFSSGTVDIALADGGSPALLTSGEAPGVRAVVMPMRI